MTTASQVIAVAAMITMLTTMPTRFHPIFLVRNRMGSCPVRPP